MLEKTPMKKKTLTKTFYTTTLSVVLLMVIVLSLLPTPAEKTYSEPNSKSGEEADFSKTLLIKNATIFTGEQLLENHDIRIEDGIIQQMGQGLSTDGASVIDAVGKTAIPGLIDAHTHSFLSALGTALNFGVSTHIDMFTAPALLQAEIEKRANVTQATEADLFSAGMLATIDGGHGTQFGIKVKTISSPSEAKDWVSKRLKEGSDFIKIVYMPYSDYFNSIDRATAAAIIKAAHERGLLVVAHISSRRAARELLEEGVDGFVHIFADQKVDDDFIRLAKSRPLFVIPTLSVIASAAQQRLGAKLAADPLIEPHLAIDQQQQLHADMSGSKIPGFDLSIALYNTRRLHQAGVTILAGSDSPNPGTAYGASIHQELELLTNAGLSPTQALKSATSEAARIFKLNHRGRLAVGMKADVLVLNMNPTENILATRDISSIYKNGRPVERTTRDSRNTEQIPSATLSDFSSGVSTQSMLNWAKTDDSIAGGKSSATIEPEGDHLSVNASVKPGFMFPWAGAGAFSEQQTNISKYQSLQFRVRGSAGQYRAMMFSGANAGAPPSQAFKVTQQWQTISLNLDRFRGLDSARFYGIAIVAGPGIGEFKYQLDSVKLIE